MRMLFLISLLSFFIISCAGREGRPVSTHITGDDTRSCDSLKYEIRDLRMKIQELVPESSKSGKNVALGVGGLFFFPAWFFMDFKNGEKSDLKSYTSRHNYLQDLAQAKKCNFYN